MPAAAAYLSKPVWNPVVVAMKKISNNRTPVTAPTIQLMSWNLRYARSPRMFRSVIRTMKTVPKMNQVVGSFAHAPMSAMVWLPLARPYELRSGPSTNWAIQYPPMPPQNAWLIAAAKLAMKPIAGWNVRDRKTWTLPVLGMIEANMPYRRLNGRARAAAIGIATSRLLCGKIAGNDQYVNMM